MITGSARSPTTGFKPTVFERAVFERAVFERAVFQMTLQPARS